MIMTLIGRINYFWLYIFVVYGNNTYYTFLGSEIASNVASISKSLRYVINNDFAFSKSSVICVFLQGSSSNAYRNQSYIVNDFIKNTNRLIPFQINGNSTTCHNNLCRNNFNVFLVDSYESFR